MRWTYSSSFFFKITYGCIINREQEQTFMFKLYLKFPVTTEKQSQRQRPKMAKVPLTLLGGKASLYRLQKRHIQMREAQLPGRHILASGLLSAPRLHFQIHTRTEPTESHLQAKTATDGGRAAASPPLDYRPE